MEKVTHIKNYGKVLKMIEAFFAAREKEDRDRIAEYQALLDRIRAGEKDVTYRNGDTCTESGLAADVKRLEAYLAPPWRGKPRKDTLLAWKASMLKRLEAADRAGEVTEITFKIEWHRSRTWGNCPSCETWVHYKGEAQDAVRDADGSPMKYGDGKPVMMSTHYNPRTYASGCGYCKRSTVMSEGIQCPAVDRLVIEHEKCWNEYAIDGKDCLPHLSFGGKGVETLCSLFRQYCGKAPIPGFNWEWQEGKNWDYIHIVRLPAKRGK